MLAMSFEHRGAWIQLAVTIGAYATYLTLLVRRADGAPLSATPYGDLIAWMIGGSIVVGVVLTIIIGMFGGERARRTDVRDRAINRLSDQVGASFIIIGAVAAMILAILEVEHFWIANAILVGFVASGILSSIARIVMHRTGVPSW
ncbi:hypothetical protein [Microcella alkaliphila]|nr:hypothetical protein [Microcella alkaliphila]